MTVTVVPHPLDTGSAEVNWAEKEVGGAKLGDIRLTRRVVEILKRFTEKPQAAIPQATGGWAAAKATYRFMDNEKVEPDAILKPHRDRAAQRSREHPVVLAIGDTTMLDYTSHPMTEGLGPLSDLDHQGFLLHPTLVVTPERVPLGLIDNLVWTRDLETFAKGDKDKRSIDEKESVKWLSSLAAAEALQLDLAESGAETTVVSVFDREGDIYDVLAATTEMTCELLVRAKNDRRVDHGLKKLFLTMETRPQAGTIRISLPATSKRTAREAEMVIRFDTLTVKPPKNRKASEGFTPIAMQVVYAEEQHPPQDEDPVRWMLLTSVAVESFDDACTVLSWYCCRWSIELLFRILKSGCETEDRRLETADRLRRCLVLDLIVAWRVLYLTTVGRDTPDLPCTVIFDDYEWKSLYLFIRKKEDQVPKETPTIREVTRLIGRLGGHLGRKSDKEPGQTTMWRGLSRLSDISSFWVIINSPEQTDDRNGP